MFRKTVTVEDAVVAILCVAQTQSIGTILGKHVDAAKEDFSSDPAKQYASHEEAVLQMLSYSRERLQRDVEAHRQQKAQQSRPGARSEDAAEVAGEASDGLSLPSDASVTSAQAMEASTVAFPRSINTSPRQRLADVLSREGASAAKRPKRESFWQLEASARALLEADPDLGI